MAKLIVGCVAIFVWMITGGPAQAQWPLTAGGALEDHGWGIAIDSEENIYQIGSFQGPAVFPDTTLPATGGAERYLAKYSAEGGLLWMRTDAGARNHALLAADSQGNVYAAEAFWTEAELGDSSFSSRGFVDYLLAKYSSDGDLLWFHHIGGPQLEGIFGMAAEDDGGLVIAGGFFRETTIGQDTVLVGSGPNHTIYVARFSEHGELMWVDIPGSACGDWTVGIALDAEGNSYIGGSVGCDGSFGQHQLTAGDGTVFLARYNPDGDVDWVVPAARSHSGNHYSNGLAVTHDRVVLVSTFTEEVDFGSVVLESGAAESMYAAAYSTSGEFEWATELTGVVSGNEPIVHEQGRGIVADSVGGAVVYGLSSVPMSDTFPGSTQYFMARIDESGAERWTRPIGSRRVIGDENGATLFNVAADGGGRLLLSGSFEGTVDLLGDTLTAAGSSDIFLTTSPVESGVAVQPPPAIPPSTLRQNHPNPFRGSTSISFRLSEPSRISLVVYDVRGREVARLVDGRMGGGVHSVTFDASRLASGVYVYRLTTSEFVETRRMVRLR